MPEEQRIDETAQTSLAVTIYNDDLALIKDQRQIQLEPGDNRLAWRNVSVRIRPETALLDASGSEFALSVLEQNFDFDLLTPNSLLKKYLGRRVEVVRTNEEGERTTESATVLAVNEGVVLRYADRIETEVVGHLSFPDVPEDLRDQPTLVLHVQSTKGGTGRLELSYLTGGLSWKADYVADMAQDGQTLDLNGWITLTNNSGIGYRNAQLQLVAGEVNQTRPDPSMIAMERGVLMSAAAPMPVQESLAEYHLYTLPRPSDVLNQQTKQVALLSAPGVAVTQELVVQGQAHAYQSGSGDGWTRLPVASMLKFLNQDGSLGVPLPKGIVRVYSKDSRGNAQFIGEDAIDHTPKNATVTLKLGESFDVTAKRKQTAFKKLAGSTAYDYAYQTSFEMELKNAKSEPVTVVVREHIPGDWNMLAQSLAHTKESASLASWRVEVPAEGSTRLTWTARIRH